MPNFDRLPVLKTRQYFKIIPLQTTHYYIGQGTLKDSLTNIVVCSAQFLQVCDVTGSWSLATELNTVEFRSRNTGNKYKIIWTDK